MPAIPETAPGRPGAIVLGQGKAGTSLIYRVLERHPDIGLSQPKELHYFSARYDRGAAWYLDHFSATRDRRLIVEVSPSYLDADAVERIAKDLGTGIKVIFSLRRPIEQAYSRYLQNLCARREPLAFDPRPAALQHRLDKLFVALERLHALFAPGNILPLFFERDIATASPAFEAKLIDFLGLPGPERLPDTDRDRVNPGVMPRYLFSGDGDLRIWAGNQEYRIPAGTLVFCGQQRNSQVRFDPTEAEVTRALATQSRWTPELRRVTYTRLRQAAVLPMARKIEERFGYDMSHWDAPSRVISYPPAPPPNRFRV